MALNLSIKRVPEDVARELRRRATKHHRSLQGELLAILEESVRSDLLLTPEELLAEVRKSGLKTREESARFMRQDRNARSHR
jgi:plasmid stability protein